MENESRYIVRKVVIDVVCLAIVSFPILIFYVFVTPFQRGFFCEDETIKYPFKGSTVSSLTLYFVGFGLPILVMLFLEYVNFQNSGQRNHTVHSALGFRIHPWVWRSYCAIGIFGFGVACTVLATDFGKYIIGRLRPHFIDACKPDIDCSLAKYKNVYILPSEFQCVDPLLEKKARLSFPSGHSSFAFYTMVYLIIYLQKNFTWGGSKLLRPVIQFFCFSIAFCTALSRVSDNKHHWSDVLAGSFLGISFALIVAFYISDLCEKKRPTFGLQNERELKDRENSSLHNTNTNHGSISPN